MGLSIILDGKTSIGRRGNSTAAIAPDFFQSQPPEKIKPTPTHTNNTCCPGDDAAAYQSLIQSFVKRHQPVGDAEQNLVQSLADTEWRLLRIPDSRNGNKQLAERMSEIADSRR